MASHNLQTAQLRDELAAGIRRWLQHRGVSTNYAAQDLLDLSPSTYIRLMKGRRDPVNLSLGTVTRVAATVGMRVVLVPIVADSDGR